jgi:hypothetical protein
VRGTTRRATDGLPAIRNDANAGSPTATTGCRTPCDADGAGRLGPRSRPALSIEPGIPLVAAGLFAIY